MIIRKLGSELYLLYTLLISQFVSSCHAFTFAFSSQPSQCQSLTAQWSGGQGPYRLFLIPVGHVTPEIRTIVNIEIPAGQSTTNLTLQFPQNSQFVAVMSDATGFGTGGTSTIYTVGSGPSDCLPSSPTKADFYMYFAKSSPSQCGAFGITWDTSSPVHIYGVIPGGQSFDLGAPSSGTGFDWTANVRQGTQMLFLAVGQNNENGGSSDISTVGGGSSGCINAQSPSSTASPAAGGVSTIAQQAPGSPTATVTNPAQPSGTATGTGVAGATGSAGASGTAGASGSAGATGTGGSNASPTGWSPTVTTLPTQSGGHGNPNDPPGQSTLGSGGGTVTGDPNLPVATNNHFENPRKLNLAAIIGGTLGGLSAVLMLILFWLWCARRRRRRQTDDRERLISRDHRTDLLADSVPVFRRHSSHMQDWFRAEPFVPPMTAEEFAERTGGSIHEDQDDEYRDDDDERPMSSLGHAALTNSSAAAAMYGALARTPSYSTSGHGHRNSTQLSHSQNVSHSPAHSTSRHGNSSRSHHGHSRSFSNPFSSNSFTPNSGVSGFTPTSGISGGGRRDITPPTPMSAADPFAAAVSRPPPSSWNQASGSSNAVPRARRSTEMTLEGKAGEEEMNEPLPEGDIVDIPPSYDSVAKRSMPRVRNP